MNGIAPGWKRMHNYNDAANGRIWIIWDDSWYDVQQINRSAQLIHCQVKERSKGFQFNFSVIYGFNTIEQRKSLWTDLNKMAQNVISPWLIIGDFNAVLSPQDRQAGAPVNESEIRDFADCVKTMGIHELQWKGSYYTWRNKQIGNTRVLSRIDRAFGNDEWMDKWGHVILEYGNPGVSDHSTMQLVLHQSNQHVRASFKFFNIWVEHESFLGLVEKVWKKEKDRDAMEKVWNKLKALQPVLKQLNRKEFKYISNQIEEARNELGDIQYQLYHQARYELVAKEKELLLKLEKWSLIEESALRQKARAKWIKLGDANNKYFSSVIKERSQKKNIRSLMSLDGRKLSEPQEIQDEFVLFYKSLMGTAAEKLAAIDVQVMKRGFIPGRKIGDNIILAHELVKAYTRKNVSPRSMLKIDLQKAYDSVEWPYLEQVMEGLGFPELFIHWVMQCVKTVNYTIVVNGQNTQRFDAAKGLRQGDPMSPFLFTIAMEYFSRLLKGLKEDTNFKYHPKCAKLDITHLCFADDLLLFSRGDLKSIKAIQTCFSEFSQALGLQANLNKSSIYCGGI
nr:uncharacterized protein LOC104644590 [Solanum lycopersicum]